MLDDTKQSAQKLAVKNKLLTISCMLFIMLSLFLVCYSFFFRSVTIDVTEHVKLVYDGESGSATVLVENNNHNLNQRTQEFLDSIFYTVTPDSNLSNGSLIQITAHYDEGLAAKYHINVANETKEIAVEGLAARFEDVEDIDQTFQLYLNEKADQFFEKNMSMILQDDFTDFTSDGNVTYVKKERQHRIFLQSLNRDNKDKVADIYTITAKGPIKTAEYEVTAEQEATINYLLVYDDVNTKKELKDENIYGEKIIHMSILTQGDLEAILRQKFSLNYIISIIK